MHLRTQKTLNTEREMTVNQIRKNITDAAFFVAEDHIKNTINNDLHQKYINEFIDSLQDIKI